jgi:Ca-activated chloride channel family protein
LISRLTSLVAVDKTPSRPADARLTRAELPLNLPEGWDFDKVFGKPGTPAGLPGREHERPDAGQQHAAAPDAADVQKIAAVHTPAAANTRSAQAKPTVALPRTATDAPLAIWLGLMMLIANLPLILFARRQARHGAE